MTASERDEWRDSAVERLAFAVLPLLPHSVGCHAHGAGCICVNRRASRAAELAAALLPVVREIVDQRAAEAAVDALMWSAWTVEHSPGIKRQAKAVTEIRARAAVLAPTEPTSEGTTR